MTTTTDTANALAAALAATEATLPTLEDAARNHANALRQANEMGVGPLRRQQIIRGAQAVTSAILNYHDMLTRLYDPRVMVQDGGGGK